MFENIRKQYIGITRLTHLAQSIVTVESDKRYRQLTENIGMVDSLTLDYCRKFKCEFAVMTNVKQGKNLSADFFTVSIRPYETYSFVLSMYERLLLLYFYNRDIYTNSFLCTKFYGTEMNVNVFVKLVHACQTNDFTLDEEISDLEKKVFCYHFLVDVESKGVTQVTNFLNSEVFEQ